MKRYRNVVSRIVLLLLWGVQLCYAQPVKEVNNHSIFAYVFKEKGVSGTMQQNNNPVGVYSNYRHEVVNKVLHDLVEARGDRRQQPPVLEMNNRERYVAWMNPNKIVIGLEQKAYDICVEFGQDSLNAMAALLGHELIHYYEKHNWSRHFARDHKELDTGQKIKSMEEGLINETQADYLGSFLGYSAGYNTLDILPILLEKVYKAYELPEEINGYPSLDDRIRIARKSMKKLTELVNVFQMANYLVVLEHYEDARTYLQYILKDFQSRELYNNIGVLTTLEALQYFDNIEEKLGYPVELDATSRLNKGTRGNISWSERKDVRNKLLKEAVRHFELAIELDKGYTRAYLNIACAYTLLGDLGEAEYYTRKTRKLAKNNEQIKLLAGTYVIQGICAKKEGNSETAIECFDKAIVMKSPLAAVNKSILKDEKITRTIPAISQKKLSPERIEGVLLDQYLKELEVDTTLQINKRILLAYKNFPASKVMIHLIDKGKAYVILHITNENYKGESGRGISVGNHPVDIREKYGPSDRTIEYSHGQYMWYPKTKLFFITDFDNKIKQWATYRIKELAP